MWTSLNDRLLLAFACDSKVGEHVIGLQGVETIGNERPLLAFACDNKVKSHGIDN